MAKMAGATSSEGFLVCTWRWPRPSAATIHD